MAVPISRETAIRIGNAARALPGVTVADLVEGLAGELGWPLDEFVLNRVTVTQLRSALARERSTEADAEFSPAETADRFPVTHLKEVVEMLWGQRVHDLAEPSLDDYEEGDMLGSIRIAVAADSGEEIDAHFGSAARFLVYQVSTTEIRLIDMRRTDAPPEVTDGTGFRVGLIDDCHLLLVQSIGGPAAAKVINAGIYPLKATDGGPARLFLAILQQRMASSPPPWLAKAMKVPIEDRIRLHREAEV
jgi:nitrogen fixation protein NifX